MDTSTRFNPFVRSKKTPVFVGSELTEFMGLLQMDSKITIELRNKIHTCRQSF